MEFKNHLFIYDTSKGYCRLVDREYSDGYKIISHKTHKKINIEIVNVKCKLAILIINESDDYQIVELLKGRAEIILLGVRPAIKNSYLLFDKNIVVFELQVKKKEFLLIVNDLLKNQMTFT